MFKHDQTCKLLFQFAVIPALVIFQACGEDPNEPMLYRVAKTHFQERVLAEGVLEAKEAQFLVTPRVWPQPKIGYLAPEGSKVVKGQLVVQLESDEIEIRYVNALDELGIAKAEANEKEARIRLESILQRAKLKNAEAVAAISRLQVKKLTLAVPKLRKLTELELKKSELEAEKARKKLASLKIIEEEERALHRAKIKKAQGKVTQQKRFLDQLALKAPRDGIVVYQKNRSTGEKVQEGDSLYGGMPVVKIPDLSVMQAKLSVTEVEAQTLKKGQEAVVTIPSLRGLLLTGSVTKVARRAVPVKRGSKVKRVEIVVEITSDHEDLATGLTANAAILVEDLKDVFVIPADCLFDLDSTRVLYVRRGGSFSPESVKIMSRGDDFVAITANLKDGEMIALRVPAQ